MPGCFLFGYAKPVPVIASRLCNPAKHMPLVALSGPLSNLIMAFAWSILLFVLGYFALDVQSNFFYQVASVGVIFNLILFAFNMLPILPLDGGRVLMGLLPANMAVCSITVPLAEPRFRVHFMPVVKPVSNYCWVHIAQ